MKMLTKSDIEILATCPSWFYRFKTAVCLIFEVNGGDVEQYPRQLVGVDELRTRVKTPVDYSGQYAENKHPAGDKEVRVVICGYGLTRWWAKSVWISVSFSEIPSKPVMRVSFNRVTAYNKLMEQERAKDQKMREHASWRKF